MTSDISKAVSKLCLLKAGAMTQLAVFAYGRRPPASSSALHELGVAVHTWTVEAGGSEVQPSLVTVSRSRPA